MCSFAQLFVFATAVAAAAASTKVKWNGLHATWNIAGPAAFALGKGFYTLPLTMDEAEKDGYVKARQEELVCMWCLPDDPRVCMLYDNSGSVAGIQVAFLLDDLKNTPYDWTAHSLFHADNVFGLDVAAGRLYLVSQDVLKAGGRTTIDEVGTGVWLLDGDDFVNVPLDADKLEPLGWTKENCVPTMGRHFYYNISETMQCEDFEPFFVLTDSWKNYVHGMGFQTIGKKSVKHRDWDEVVPSQAVKPTLPNAPACLAEWADKYGILSVHMYFTKFPYLNILC